MVQTGALSTLEEAATEASKTGQGYIHWREGAFEASVACPHIRQVGTSPIQRPRHRLGPPRPITITAGPLILGLLHGAGTKQRHGTDASAKGVSQADRTPPISGK